MSAMKVPSSSDDGNGTLVIAAGRPHDARMEERIAVLEEIAATTKSMLADMRTDVRAIGDKQEAGYRSLAGKIYRRNAEALRRGRLGGCRCFGCVGARV